MLDTGCACLMGFKNSVGFIQHGLVHVMNATQKSINTLCQQTMWKLWHLSVLVLETL